MKHLSNHGPATAFVEKHWIRIFTTQLFQRSPVVVVVEQRHVVRGPTVSKQCVPHIHPFYYGDCHHHHHISSLFFAWRWWLPSICVSSHNGRTLSNGEAKACFEEFHRLVTAKGLSSIYWWCWWSREEYVSLIKAKSLSWWFWSAGATGRTILTC